MTLLHVVPGPEAHGVVRHGLLVHPHLGGADLLRPGRLDDLGGDALAARTVVVQATDRVLAADPVTAVEVWHRVTGPAARVTVVLHDLPQASDGRWRAARTRLYATLAAHSDDVVVASEHERLLLAAALRHERPEAADAVLARVHVIPLPVQRSAAAEPRPHVQDRAPASVVTLGYVYPGKGLEEVVDAAARAARDPRLEGRAVEVRNLGRASDGHEDLPARLADRARAAGVRWSTSGWVDDDDLPAALAAATVPVAAHRHLSASGSISTWLAAGRRPVVLRSRYTEELAARMPDAVTLVLPDGLAEALVSALQDPSGTWLGPQVRLGPDAAGAGARLAEVAHGPAVSVVVPYYRNQELLDLLLRRVAAQAGVAGGLEVVVADDGSPRPPETGSAGQVPVRVVRQEDRGFRAGAARNLGARAARGRVLAFLDGDTVPDDDYLATLQQACLGGTVLAVGRRRHADLRGLLRGAGREGAVPWPPAEPLPEPGWLTQGYAATQDLEAADDTSFRFVISAVMGVGRPLWEAVGGFDEELVGYGGEDWDLAWRAWLAGARLRHLPAAVAWHDGADLGGRQEASAELARVKNAETARLAPRLPHPLVRGRGWVHDQPDVVVVLHPDGWSAGQLVVVTESLLRQGDVGIWMPAASLEELGAEVAGSGRLHAGLPAARVRRRARALVEVDRPVAVLRLPWQPWPSDLSDADVTGDLVDEAGSGVRVTLTRTAATARLAGHLPVPGWLPQACVEPVPVDVVVERWRQGHP
ncbi:glycosyltransferase [Ornithinimicrobium pekingense]|uniref:glycosyltransferase n=1 Tax=Ornithinimicrobium pekingense TaxID=384677 RepID=UPI000412433A|nr:glycosyltransferase [Ornithinimicrobium pekingense]